MKNLRNASALWLLALGLSVAFQACKEKEPEVIDPDVTTLSAITMPTVPTTQPQAVVATSGSVAPSAASTSAITSIVATSVTPAVTQAQANTRTALAGASPASLVSGMTQSVITNFVNTGTLPAALQTQLAAITSNPAFASYLPTLTRPTINGTAVGSVKPAVSEVSLLDVPESFALAATSNDACFAKAQAALDQVRATITASRGQQEAAVNATFTARQTTINANATSCAASSTQATAALNTSAVSTLNAALAAITTLVTNNSISAADGDVLRAFVYGNFFAAINSIRTLDAAEKAKCAGVQTRELAEATRVRTTDLAAILAAFNTANANAGAEFLKSVQVCHNQGSGN